MKKAREDAMSLRVAKSVYDRTPRRGFLAKSAAALMALGLGEAVFSAQPASATNCSEGCCGPDCGCSSCPGACPNSTSCGSGWHYSGYRWACCNGTTAVYCRDCCKNGTNCSEGTGNRCICVCGTRITCKSPEAARLAAEIWSAGLP